MNAVMKLGLAVILGIELSFTPSLSLNVGLIIASLIYLLIYHIHWKVLLYLMVVPFIPAIGVAITQAFYGAGIGYGIILTTRIYAYILLGADLAINTTAIEMTNALEENCHLPAKFAFGILSALNLVPQIIYQVKIIKVSAEMRGVRLTWLSPTLYFKAILASIEWADQLANAMKSHGFVEDAPRTHYYQYPIHPADWAKSISLLIIIQLLIFV